MVSYSCILSYVVFIDLPNWLSHYWDSMSIWWMRKQITVSLDSGKVGWCKEDSVKFVISITYEYSTVFFILLLKVSGLPQQEFSV